jgi:hypothetical protein
MRAFRNRQLSLLKEQLDDELEEVLAQMKARKWPRVVFGTLCRLVSAAIPRAAGVAAGTSLEIIGGASTLAHVVPDAYDQTRSRKRRTAHPLAYAALARDKLSSVPSTRS